MEINGGNGYVRTGQFLRLNTAMWVSTALGEARMESPSRVSVVPSVSTKTLRLSRLSKVRWLVHG